MGTYVPNTREEQQKMLESCGFQSFDDMYACIPEDLRLRRPLDLPEGKTELEVRRAVEKLARKNRVYPTVFRGAGAYRHYIPSIVSEVVGKEEFRTAYTPYQAEISQGVLQSIFEFQTDICELTGLSASNASVYDGATAAAEACEMCRERKRTKVLVSETVDPKILSVVRTYGFGRGAEVAVVPEKDGVTDLEALKTMLDDETACLLIQQPNFFGCVEDADGAAAIVHEAKVKLIMSCNPIALTVMKTPGEIGADVAVGSRYCKGVSVVDWPMSRIVMSYFASTYVRTVLRMKVYDTTAGFVCYSRKVLEAIDLDAVKMKGYGFQIEMKYTAWKKGFKLQEVPIIFTNRQKGTSKMSGGIFGEAFWGVIGLRFRKF